MKNKLFNLSNPKFSKKKGFTLTEVMVAVTILGVLATVLYSLAHKVAPSNNKVLFKKAYYDLSEAVAQMINDESLYPSSEVNTGVGSTPRNFNYTQLSTTPTYYTSNKFCYLLSERLNTISVNCQAYNSTSVGNFTTSDGMYWQIYVPYDDVAGYTNRNTATTSTQFPVCNPTTATVCTSSYYTTLVTVDVNGTGASHPPNCSTVALTNPTVSACAAGIVPDTYRIGVRFDGKLDVSTDSTAINILSNPTVNTK